MKKQILSGFLAVCLFVGTISPALAAAPPNKMIHDYPQGKTSAANISAVNVPDVMQSTTSAAQSVSALSNLSDFKIDGTTLVSYLGSDSVVTVPDGITKIGDAAFKEKSVSQVILPDSVTQIGSNAFSGCKSLTSINIPNGVSEILDSAFLGCESLKSIVIPNSVKTFGSNLFMNCTNLTDVTLPDGLTRLPDRMFYQCSSLKQMIIPNSVQTIGSDAFDSCTSLADITFPDSLEEIDDCAFESCTSLQNLMLPEGLGYIGCYAFYGCNKLVGVILPSTLTSIQNEAFAYCDNLTAAIILSKNLFLSDDAFYSTDVVLCGFPCSTTESYAHENGIPYFNFYNLTVTAGSGGSCTTGSGLCIETDTVDLKATPDSGYHFDKWVSSNGNTFANANAASTTFTMPSGDTTVTAQFVKDGTSSGDSSGSSSGSHSYSGGGYSGGGSGASSSDTSSEPEQPQQPAAPQTKYGVKISSIPSYSRAYQLYAALRQIKVSSSIECYGKNKWGLNIKYYTDIEKANAVSYILSNTYYSPIHTDRSRKKYGITIYPFKQLQKVYDLSDALDKLGIYNVLIKSKGAYGIEIQWFGNTNRVNALHYLLSNRFYNNVYTK